MKEHVLILLGLLLLVFINSCKEPQETTKEEVESTPLRDYETWEKKNKEGNWESFRKVEYVYDDKKQIVKNVSKKIVNDSLFPEYRDLKTYDTLGNMIRFMREYWKNDDWEFVWQSVFKFNNRKTISKISSFKRGDDILTTETTFNYDADDNLLSELNQDVKDSVKVNSDKVIYSYNDMNLPIVKEFPIWSENGWVNSRKMVLEYNEKGHHINTTRYTWKDEKWIKGTHYKLEVDTLGTRLSEIWERQEEDRQKTEVMRVTYTFLPDN